MLPCVSLCHIIYDGSGNAEQGRCFASCLTFCQQIAYLLYNARCDVMIGFVFFTKFLDTLQMSPRLSASHIVENMDIDSQFLRHPYDLFAFGKFLTGALYRSLVDSSARIVADVYILVQTIIS